MENPPTENQTDSKARKAALWSQMAEIGLDFAAYLAIPLLGFIYAGKWLDAKYHHKFFVIIGVLLGLAIGWYMVYKKIKGLNNFLDK